MEEVNTQQQFGMTAQDEKRAARQEWWRRIHSVLAQVGPAVVKTLSTAIYYLIRFLKAFVTTSFRMILGKEV